jgi:hypothetical protein
MSKVRLRVTSGIVVSVVAVAAVIAVGRVASSLSSGKPVGITRESAQPPISGTTSETFLRKWAVKTVMPEFPTSAIREHRIGVAVAIVYLDLSGRVSKVEILRSPAPAIADSMSAALSQWIFRPEPLPDGRPVLLSGKITFYFEIEGNKGVVLDPSSVGYVGESPLYAKRRSGNSSTLSVRRERRRPK